MRTIIKRKINVAINVVFTTFNSIITTVKKLNILIYNDIDNQPRSGGRCDDSIYFEWRQKHLERKKRTNKCIEQKGFS